MSDKQNLRDHKRRLLAAKSELRRKLYKAFCKDPYLPSDMRDKHRYKLSKLPRKTRVRNLSIFTGRPRSVDEFFLISRIVFRLHYVSKFKLHSFSSSLARRNDDVHEWDHSSISHYSV